MKAALIFLLCIENPTKKLKGSGNGKALKMAIFIFFFTKVKMIFKKYISNHGLLQTVQTVLFSCNGLDKCQISLGYVDLTKYDDYHKSCFFFIRAIFNIFFIFFYAEYKTPFDILWKILWQRPNYAKNHLPARLT